jgi:hypothetical protein
VGLSKANKFSREARLRVEQPDKAGATTYHPELPTNLEGGAYVIPLNQETTWVALAESHEGRQKARGGNPENVFARLLTW